MYNRYKPKLASKRAIRAKQLEKARREVIKMTGIRDNKKTQDDNLPFYETNEFRRLNKKWHDRLEKSGFSDKEEFDSKHQFMKQWDNTKFQSLGDILFNERQRYYELATQLVHTYKFKSLLDKQIWTMHSDGNSEREIGDKLECTYNYTRKIIRLVRTAIKRDAKEILKDLDKLKESND